MTVVILMRNCLTLAVLYVFLSLGIAGFWIYIAKTETFDNHYNSIVKIADGTAPVPFVKRRLLPDLAQGMAALIPESCWDQLRQPITGTGMVARQLRSFIASQKWQPEDYPVLFCAYFLIWLSVLGFLFTCRGLVRLLYDCPRWLADTVAGVLGLALLGGAGWHYQSYPYDLPISFLFLLTLTGMIARRWWFLLPYLAAVYCKETAVLLIPAYVLLADSWRSWRLAGVCCLLGAVFVGARMIIDQNFPSPPGQFWGGFWFPARNARTLFTNIVFYSWTLPFVAVCLYKMIRLWPSYPLALRRLVWLLVPLLGLGFFRGWFEEKRQYLEVLPTIGLMVSQWLLTEFGWGKLFQARDAKPYEAELVKVPPQDSC